MNLAARFAIFALLHLLVAPLAESRPAISDEGEASSKLLPITPEIEEAVSRDLRGCKPQLGKVVAGINKNGVYTLEGDLFHNGRVHAVVDDHLGVVICEARHGHCKPVSMLNVAAVWKYPNWDSNTSGTRTPSATKPFWMLHLQNHPLLVVAETPEKQGQHYETFLFDSNVRRVAASDVSFWLAPMVKHHYLLSGDASRVKAVWGATYFSKIKNGKFVMVKTWEDFSPYDQPDPSQFDGDVTCSVASSDGRKYTIMDEYRRISHPADVVVFEGNVGTGSWESILNAWKVHRAFARLYFEPRHPKKNPTGESENPTAYVFEKLMRLPRDLYLIRDEFHPVEGADPEPKQKIETATRIKITGNRRAREILSPGS